MTPLEPFTSEGHTPSFAAFPAPFGTVPGNAYAPFEQTGSASPPSGRSPKAKPGRGRLFTFDCTQKTGRTLLKTLQEKTPEFP